MDSRALICSTQRYFETHPEGLVAAYLFGSFARETARDDSDVDIAVLFEHPAPLALESPGFAIETDLELVLGREVQVVDLHRAAPDLAHRILTDGLLLVDLDQSVRVQFEVTSRNEYFDLVPVLRRYRRAPQPPPSREDF